MTLLLPDCLDAILGVSLEVEAAGFGEQVDFLQVASKRPSTVVEVALIRSDVGSGLGPPLVGKRISAGLEVTCRHSVGSSVGSSGV